MYIVQFTALTMAASLLIAHSAMGASDGQTQAAPAAQAASSASTPHASSNSPTASTASDSTVALAAATQVTDCPSPEVVAARVREAAKLNAAEANSISGSAASQVGEMVSNVLGFGGIFSAGSIAAEISAHRKIADAMAADPCGEKVLDALPKIYRTAYEAYRKKADKK